jgi:hypothetical protein
MFQYKDFHICFWYKLCLLNNQSLIHILAYNLDMDLQSIQVNMNKLHRHISCLDHNHKLVHQLLQEMVVVLDCIQQTDHLHILQSKHSLECGLKHCNLHWNHNFLGMDQRIFLEYKLDYLNIQSLSDIQACNLVVIQDSSVSMNMMGYRQMIDMLNEDRKD